MRGAGRGMLARISVSALLLVVAAAILFSGLDRLSGSQSQLAGLVPGPFRATSAVVMAGSALALDDIDQAEDMARMAVARAPAYSDSSALLGVVSLMQDDQPQAQAAFRVAATLGWRSLPAQLYWFDASLALGEPDLALDRLDAILRINPAFDRREEYFDALHAVPGGPDAIARRLSGNPPWAEAYFVLSGEPSREILESLADVARAVASSGEGGNCPAIEGFVSGLLIRGHSDLAEAIWWRNCENAPPSGSIGDADFERFVSGSTSPFGWRAAADGDLLLIADSSEGAAAITLANSGAVSRLALTQFITLAPGSYRIRATTSQGETVGAGALVASVSCGSAPNVPGVATGDMAGDGQRVVVPACDNNLLAIWVRPNQSETTLTGITVEPAR